MRNHNHSSQFCSSPQKNFRFGFTLLELLIVIVVISVLAALILPAINSSRSTVRVAEVKNEISALERGIADFKARFGVEPPSHLVLYESPSGWNTNNTLTRESKATLKRLWPQFDFTIARDINGNSNTTDTLNLTGAECLTFFLGGVFRPDSSDPNKGIVVGFSKNPANPLSVPSSTGATREGPFFKFNPGRFVDVDSDGMKEYVDTLSGQTSPYIYLSSNDGRGYVLSDGTIASGQGIASPYTQSSSANAPAWNAKSFQIISPGMDAEYGTGGVFDKSTATNDLVGNRETERDNITNFHRGTLAD